MKFNIKLLVFALLLTVNWSCRKEDPCDNQVCLNGGACLDGDCICPDGYSGINCQTAEPCANIVCQNNGFCISGICNCPPGYSGVFCQTYDPCYAMICLNGGICLSGDCLCPTGYTGTFCEVELSPDAFRVEQIELNEFPETNGASCWDNDGSCFGDIYWVIKDGNTNILTSGHKTNCTSPNNYIYTTNLPVTLNYTTTYTLQLWDYDGVGNPDLVANSTLQFSNIYSPPLPTNTLTLSNGIISFKFRGDWIF